MAELLYLDDLQEGMRFTSRTFLLSEHDIITFAQQFDPQPFHTDPEAAKATFFQGLVASGWHTAAITMRLLTESVQIAGGLIGAGGQITWRQPVRPQDSLYITVEVLSIQRHRRDSSRGFFETLVKTFNQDNQLVQEMRSTVMGRYRDN